jgi:hypothetical protein
MATVVLGSQVRVDPAGVVLFLRVGALQSTNTRCSGVSKFQEPVEVVPRPPVEPLPIALPVLMLLEYGAVMSGAGRYTSMRQKAHLSAQRIRSCRGATPTRPDLQPRHGQANRDGLDLGGGEYYTREREEMEAYTRAQVTRVRARLSTSSRPSSLSAPEHRYYHPASFARRRPFAIEGCQSSASTCARGWTPEATIQCAQSSGRQPPATKTAREWYDM